MKTNKLENPERLMELDPSATLRRVGLGENDLLCDIGAGTGIFTVPAAKITSNTVFATELNEELIRIIRDKAHKDNLDNIRTLLYPDNWGEISKTKFDFVLLVTVFHEINDKNSFLNEVKSITKKTGRLVIIEFHGKPTKFGPPVEHRIGKSDVDSICSSHGFTNTMNFDLGPNFYCTVFKQQN